MATQVNIAPEQSAPKTDWVALIHKLGPTLAERGAAAEQTDAFVAENFAELKRYGFYEAAVPTELGGGGASVRELADMLRALAPYCASTALAFAMHTHQVAVAAWRWRHQQAPLEPLLRRIVRERILLVGTGGGDWLEGSGRAEKVEGGWRVSGRKSFASGAPAGDLFMTTAVADTPEGRQVLHFGVPFSAAGVKMMDDWRASGMRATGSHDVVLDGVFVADAAIGGKRPVGKWHPLYHMVCMIALPLVYSVYTGIADQARSAALAHARSKSATPSDEIIAAAGEMENRWQTADVMLARLLVLAESDKPGPQTTQWVLHARTEVATAAIATVEKAMVLVGSTSYLRRLPYERMWRDVQGARFHPLSETRQVRHAGRHALGLSIDP